MHLVAGTGSYYDERISEYLCERGLLDEEGIARAQRVRERLKEYELPRPFAHVLRDLGLVPPDELKKAVEYSTTPTEQVAAPGETGEAPEEDGRGTAPALEPVQAGFARDLLAEMPNLSGEEKKAVFAKLRRACNVGIGDDEQAWREWLSGLGTERTRETVRWPRKPTTDLPAHPPTRMDLEEIAEATLEEAEQEVSPQRAPAGGEEETGVLKGGEGESPTDMLPAARTDAGAPPALPRGYKLLSRIGKGATGTVYKAQQMSLNRVVALKVLSESLSRDTSFIERFLREAKVAAALTHPNVVGAIDVGESGGKYYYAMEFVDGESVRAILRREKVLPEKRAVLIAFQMAKALEYAQGRGLIHRDVKPDNILMDKVLGTAKLADMGLARPVKAEDGEKAITKEGMALGTANYVSPEQARGMDLDTRTDVYALGATLFHMVTGRPPFRGKGKSEVVHKHLTKPPPRADEVNPEVSQETALVILKAMEKDRENRYQTPGAMASDLSAIMREEAPAIAAEYYEGRLPLRRRPTVRGMPAPRRRLSERAVLTVLGGVIAAAFVGAVVFFQVHRWKVRAAEEQRYEELVTRARDSIADEEYDGAIGLLEEAAKLKDTDKVQRLMRLARHGTCLSRARAAEAEGDLGGAIGWYDRALKIKDDDELREHVDELRRKLAFAEALGVGDRLLKEGDWKGALDACRKALGLAAGPEIETVGKRMQAAEEKGRYATAMARGTRALKARKWNDAIVWGEEALAVSPGDEAAAKLVASARRGEEDERESRAYALAMAEGREALAKRAWSEAVGRGEAALGVKPGDGAAKELIASARRGGREETEAAYSDAMANGRRAIDARAWEEAVTHAVAALEIKPEDEAAGGLIAAARRGQEEEKEAAYAEAVAGADKSARGGEWGTVTDLARSALKIRPGGERAGELLRLAAAELGLARQVTNSTGMDFCLVPAGEFVMGSEDGQADERPVRRVYLDSYYISKYEVTNSQFEEFRPGHSHKWRRYSPKPDMPVIAVSWEDADAFCRWLTGKETVLHRLPTEVEWEKAARGARGAVYPWGIAAPDEDGVYRCNFRTGEERKLWAKDRFELVAPAGNYPSYASPYGVMDMAGNVWEWCLDWYAAYPEGEAKSPLGPEAGEKRVLRGGSFANGPDSLRCANRSAHFPGFSNVNVGFRCVRLPGKQTASKEEDSETAAP